MRSTLTQVSVALLVVTPALSGQSADAFEGMAFRGIGPSLTTGRIADVEIDPNNANVWYVAAGSGGLWKTVNRGDTWTPIFDDYPSYSQGSVVVDPRDSNIVWLGTGENSNSRSASYGDGVYKSYDAGQTWQRVGLEQSEHIQEIVIDPRDSDVVYVAAQGPLWAPGGHRGLYKTTDGGETWTRVLHVSEDTGITDMAFDPDDPDVIYAAAYQRRRALGQLIGGGQEAGIFKSTDAAVNWQKLDEGLPTVDKGRIALATDPHNPGRVYAQVVAQGDEGGFFRSEDSGATWVRTSEYAGGDPQYYGEIWVDPHQPETIWTIEVRIHRSTDGGRTFEPMNYPIHVDHHEIVFDESDPQHMIIGNDGGLYETRDSGKTWRHFTNLPLSQFYRVSVDDARPFYNVCGGTQDNGTHCGPSRTMNSVGIRTSDWIQVGGGDGFQGYYDRELPHIVYSQSQNGNLGRLDLQTGQRTDIRPLRPVPNPDGGPPADSPDRGRWHWDSPLVLSPHSTSRLYYAGNRLYRSDDRGDTWIAVSGDLTRQLDRDTIPVMGRIWPEDAVARNLYTTEISVITSLDESPLLEGLLYVGTDDGLVQISEDGGASWRQAERFPGLPANSYVTDVFASRRDASTLFVTFNNWQRGDFRPHVVKSEDRGRSWTNITGNLPERSGAWSIVQDHADSDLLFAGLEFGVFFSADGGTDWTQLAGGIPVSQARDLHIQRRENDLVVGTFGRGAYILDDYTPLRAVSDQTLAADAFLFPARPAYLYDERNFVRAAWGNETAPNPPYGAVLTYHLREAMPDGESLVVTIMDESGERVRQVELPEQTGVQRITWDLRRDPGPPPAEGAETPGQRRRRQGEVVSPGRYIAALGRLEGERVTPIGEPQTILVTRLRD